MTDNPMRLVQKAARQLHRQTGEVALAGVIVGLPDGKRGLAWSMGPSSPHDLEMVAVGLLMKAEQETAESAIDCPDCAARWARVTAALAALADHSTHPGKGHAH